MPKDTRLLGDQVTADPLPRSPGPKAYAIVLIGETGSATYRVPSSGSLILGRSPECSVPIDDASISRKHAAVHAGDPPTLEDLGSRNGTRALGHRLAPGERHLLATGTSVELGNVVMVIQRVGPGVLASSVFPVLTASVVSPSQCSRRPVGPLHDQTIYLASENICPVRPPNGL